MDFITKLIAGFIERSCKHYITTIIGVLSVCVFACNTFFSIVPAQYQQWVNLGASVLSGIALILAKDSGQPTENIPTGTKLGAFVLFGLICLTATPQANAQSTTQPVNIYALGASYNSGASPAVAGTAMFAHLASPSTSAQGTYAFTVIDILPISTKPATVATNIGAGIAQQLVTLGKATIYTSTSAGISMTGSNTGWNWTGGGMVSIPFQVKGKTWYAMPNVRYIKSSVNNNSGYQLIGGAMLGWGS